ncbi:urease accessory [Fusarium albosuccineum]|uniref:Urease accessory n=1 Tax=Fusarium albosuccineum TaxID=1237068 RepID=A0A8H4LAP8_9HYPO|nr:urease accessory [Fusarium albosuccineum]
MASRHFGADATNDIQDEIFELERRLQEAKERLQRTKQLEHPTSLPASPGDHLASTTHFLFLLSDSALPLGSFAFSSGLESYLAHTPRASASFASFLPSSLSSFASTTLPFVLAAHRNPDALPELDDQLDAAIICTVGRRASVAQGRALLGIWERSFRASCPHADAHAVRDFAALLRKESQSEVPLVSAHLAPLFGAICAIVGLGLRQTAYVFMLSHVKALISAAVRASVFGPYQAQKVLASQRVQELIDRMIDREWMTPVEEAGQTVPEMDLWFGRHEVLYSRIFNS